LNRPEIGFPGDFSWADGVTAAAPLGLPVGNGFLPLGDRIA
jgi:hypothetical protein